MPDSSPKPVWDPAACVPQTEVLNGTFSDAELALSLSAVVWRYAKPPYNDPRTFFAATYLTRNMQDILKYLFGRLTRARSDTNPVIVLDVGFGGGKTHTLVSLYYAAKYGNDPAVQQYLPGIPIPQSAKIVAVSGDEYGGRGVVRNNTPVSTLWGDIFYQLGVYDTFRELDVSREVPSLADIKNALGEDPVLILLDELPTYLDLVSLSDRNQLGRIVQFIQRLVNAVSEKDNAALVIAIAEDSYADSAHRIRSIIKDYDVDSDKSKAALEDSERAMHDCRALVRRKESIISSVMPEEAVQILKKRLFTTINPECARVAADMYHQAYSSTSVPDKYRRSNYRDLIENTYPFHPALIEVLYDRIATLDRFQRTRGALRLLMRVVREVWQKREADAMLIHPYHVDLANEGIMEDLSTGIGEERLRNAIEADISRSGGGAIAQILDAEVLAQWGAPLHRRTCNTIYLYSLATGREGDHGIDIDDLLALITVPSRSDYLLRVRDGVFRKLTTEFHYIDRRGTHFLFIREPNPLRIIDRNAQRDVTDAEATQIVKENLISLFSDKPDWIHVDIFPTDPSKVADEPVIKLAILNPHLFHFVPETGEVPESVSNFIYNADNLGNRFRVYKNDTFLLVAEESRRLALWDNAKKICSAAEIRKDLKRYGIPADRKQEVEVYFTERKNEISDHIRSAFCKFIYFNKKGNLHIANLNPNGYSRGKGGKEMFEYHLTEVFNRVSTEPFDPAAVENDVWTEGAPYLSATTLFDAYHKVPGQMIPAHHKAFTETLIRGVREGFWIIRHKDTIYDEAHLPSTIGIGLEWEVWKKSEAEKKGILKRKEQETTVTRKRSGYNPPVTTTTINNPSEQPRPVNHVFQDSPIETLIQDMERVSNREGLLHLDKTTLKTRGDPSVISAINNLVTRVKPLDCTLDFSCNVERYNAPTYTIHIDLAKDDMDDATARIILDALPRFKNAELFEITLSVAWNKAAVRDVSQVLRDIAKTNEDTLFTLEISGVQERS